MTAKRTRAEVCREMAKRNKGRKQSAEANAKRSRALKGRTRSEQTKKKIAAARRGTKHSEEARQSMSEKAQGRKMAQEVKTRIAKATRSEPQRVLRAARLDKKYTTAWLYVVAFKVYPGMYKVGVSTEPERRVANWRSAHPLDHVRLIAKVKVKRAYMKEARVLAQFAKVDGELVWASLPRVLKVVKEEAGGNLEMVGELW